MWLYGYRIRGIRRQPYGTTGLSQSRNTRLSPRGAVSVEKKCLGNMRSYCYSLLYIYNNTMLLYRTEFIRTMDVSDVC